MGACWREHQRRPWSLDQNGSAVKPVDSTVRLPEFELTLPFPSCANLGKSLPCPVPLFGHLKTGMLAALTT